MSANRLSLAVVMLKTRRQTRQWVKVSRVERGEQRRSRSLSGVLVGVVLAVAVVAAVIFASFDGGSPTASTRAPTVEREVTPTPPASTPTPDFGGTRFTTTPDRGPMVNVSAEERRLAMMVTPAPLGTYLVAKPTAGFLTDVSPWRERETLFEIPVYDKPYGAPRTLLRTSDVDGVKERLPLLQSGYSLAPLVLRVVAGQPGDEWIQVQAPVYPHDRTTWVRASDFEFDYTPFRIEIDLAGEGRLRLIDGGAIMMESPIVQGRPDSGTPRHVTYVEAGGLREEDVGAPYGSARLDLASFDQQRGTFGATSPRNYPHATFRSIRAGQGLRSDQIRVPDHVISYLVARIGHGTPVVIFDSSDSNGDIDAVMQRSLVAASTAAFAESSVAVSQAVKSPGSQLWVRCRSMSGSCPPVPPSSVPIGNLFAVAKEGAGDFVSNVGHVVPVYDEPGGDDRMLMDQNEIDGAHLAFPLANPTVFGQPLVLRVLQGAPGDAWFLVQAPIRPHRHSVWVRAVDFELHMTSKRIEVDLAETPTMTLFDGDFAMIDSPAVIGRESRPTTLHDTYVEQVFAADRLSPAYGTYILTLASYSEALGTYGGGGLPGQSIHGTNQPELIGQRVSSGGIRVPNEVIDFVYEQPGLLGASVVIYDSTDIGRIEAIRVQRSKAWIPALTTTSFQDSEGVVGSLPVTSYS